MSCLAEEVWMRAEVALGEDQDAADDGTPSSTSSSSPVLRAQFFQNNASMCFVEMRDVDAAFEAIIHVHDRRLPLTSGGNDDDENEEKGQRPRGKPLFVNFSKVHLKDFNKSGWETLFRG